MPCDNDQEQLLSVLDVAKMLQVEEHWVRAHANGKSNPVIESIKIGKYRRFRLGQVKAFVAKCEAIARDQALRRNRR